MATVLEKVRFVGFSAVAVVALAACQPDSSGDEATSGADTPTQDADTAAATMATIAAGFAASAPQATSGVELVESVCAACHPSEPPPQLAPPLNMVVMHYMQEHAEPAQAVAAIEAWLAAPDPSRSSMPEHAIERFGVMPPIPLTAAQREAVATYLVEEYGDAAMEGHEGGMGGMGDHEGGMRGRRGRMGDRPPGGTP